MADTSVLPIKATFRDHVAAGVYALNWGCAIATLITPFSLLTRPYYQNASSIAALFGFGLGWFVLHNILQYLGPYPGRTITPLCLAVLLLPAVVMSIGADSMSDHILLFISTYFCYVYGVALYVVCTIDHARAHASTQARANRTDQPDALRRIQIIESTDCANDCPSLHTTPTKAYTPIRKEQS